MDIVGKKLGRYHIVEELGRGGMAVVYKAYQPALERYVAIKVLPPQFAFDQQFVRRFLREARSAAALHHPNIVTIHDVTHEDGYYFIVMQFIEGKTLDQLIGQSGRLPLPRIERILSQVVEALDHAHERGLVHRDIKPSNIMVDDRLNDTVTLMDFGLVRAAEDTSLTRTGTIVGTPEYMSPEQAEGGDIDHRTDIYSLGVVLFKMVTGRVPFSKSTPHAVLIAHMTQEPPSLSSISPGLPAALEAVIRKALVKDRQGRYARVREFGRDLALASRGEMPPGLDAGPRLEAGPPPPVGPPGPPPPRAPAQRTVVSQIPAEKGGGRGWLWALGGVGALLVLALCGLGAIVLGAFPFSGPASLTATATPTVASTSTATATAPLSLGEDIAGTSTPTPTPPTPSPTVPAETAEPTVPALEPAEVVDAFIRATLGTVPGADIDYDRARELMTVAYARQFDSADFVPLTYGIQEGPSSYGVAGEDISGSTATVVVSGYWGADLGREWAFALQQEQGLWRIGAIDILEIEEPGDEEPADEEVARSPFWQLNPVLNEFTVYDNGGWKLVVDFDEPAQDVPVRVKITYVRRDDGTVVYSQEDSGFVAAGGARLTLDSDWSNYDLAQLGFRPGSHRVAAYLDDVEIGSGELVVE